MFELLKTCFVATSTLFVGDYFIRDRSGSENKTVNRPAINSKNCPLQLWNGRDQYYLIDGKLFLGGVEKVIIDKCEYDKLVNGRNEVV